jgi:hypothetical protein
MRYVTPFRAPFETSSGMDRGFPFPIIFCPTPLDSSGLGSLLWRDEELAQRIDRIQHRVGNVVGNAFPMVLPVGAPRERDPFGKKIDAAILGDLEAAVL